VSADAAFRQPMRPRTVESHPLRDLIDGVAGLRLAPRSGTDVLVSGITHDSSGVLPGDVFAALPGAHRHGADFAAEAAEHGAVAMLTDAAGAARATTRGLTLVEADDPRRALGPLASLVYGRPSAALPIIGVTGTNGKTTTSYFLAAGMRAAGKKAGLIGTVETRMGDVVVPSLHTTPEASDLQATLATMHEQGVHAVAMEVSSHALALHRVDGTAFAAAIFTNLSQDHLDFHRDIEDYYQAKARLFTPEFTNVAVVDVDDAFGARLAREVDTPVVTVSPAGRSDADWTVSDVALDAAGSSFVLHGPGGQQATARTQLTGPFNVANATLAIVALAETGLPLARAVEGVAACASVPGRMQRVEVGQPFTAVVDYAHTPDAVGNLLAALRPVTAGRLILVLGCGGDRDRSKRPLMGAAAVAGSDVAILTSDNPRSEDPNAILREMAAGIGDSPAAEVHVEADRRRAIRRAVACARPGDAVVVAGKGHERVQEIAGRSYPFDDAEELAGAIRGAVAAS
jgi:UDP-N-acetylmuramoyl-L-alanyl-D-glutamate--2,6-diaminopimelate ligase